MKQLVLWSEYKCAQKRIYAPFVVDASEATGPGYKRILWRLLSRRAPGPPFNRHSFLRFEMVLRDEKIATDIHLVRDAKDNLVPAEEE